MSTFPPSTNHALNAATQAAITLGVSAEAAARGTAIAIAAGSQETRHYHDVAHFVDLLAGSASIAATLTAREITSKTAATMANVYALVARDHDIVYLSADKGNILEEIAQSIRPYVNRGGDGNYQIIGNIAALSEEQHQNLSIAIAVFGFGPGQELTPPLGQNEFLSCLHSLEANPGITLQTKIALAAMHQATIPFGHPDSIQQMVARVAAIADDGKSVLLPDQIHAIGLAAADFANRDVAGFSGDQQKFQEDSDKLLLEAGGGNGARQRRIDFFDFLIRNSEQAIFKNYTFADASGATVSLLPSEEIDRLNAAARVQMQGEITRLGESKAVGRSL